MPQQSATTSRGGLAVVCSPAHAPLGCGLSGRLATPITGAGGHPALGVTPSLKDTMTASANSNNGAPAGARDTAGQSAAGSARPDVTFAQVFAEVADVQGWMTRAQAGRLWDCASDLRDGDQIVEIGSFHGRSAIVLASAAPSGVAITTIDPHAGNDRGPQEIEGFVDEAEADHQQFLANLQRAGVDRRITHLRAFSDQAHDGVEGDIALLYIDGAHRFAPARSDLVSWGNRVSPGGTMLVHDSFSSVGVTLALAVTTMVNGRFVYRGRSGSLAQFERRNLGPLGRLANFVSHLAQLPWFVRNVAVKALLVARLRPVARLLGSDGTWPY